MKLFSSLAGILFLFISIQSNAQTTDVITDRLCKNWGLIKIEDGTKTQVADEAQKEYRLIFNKDNTVQQGLAPDGLIPGSWKLDETNSFITIIDKSTKTSYKMKIMKLTTDELILQQVEESRTLIIYYKAV
jgi:hypothetical protein